MDDLERELRSELDRLASDRAPSDTLVERTVDRTGQIRRRRVLSASCPGAAPSTAAPTAVPGAIPPPTTVPRTTTGGS